MKTQKQITAIALAKVPSDETVSPPQHSYVAFQREELLSILGVRQPLNTTHAELLGGIENTSPGSEVIIQREHLLTAFGVDWEKFDREQAEAKTKAEAEAKASEEAAAREREQAAAAAAEVADGDDANEVAEEVTNETGAEDEAKEPADVEAPHGTEAKPSGPVEGTDDSVS